MPRSDNPARERLLQPTLTDAPAHAPLFSFGTGVVASMFGGPFAPVAWGAANSFQMHRNRADAWLHVLTALAAFALCWAQMSPSGYRHAIDGSLGAGYARILLFRIGALAILAVEYARRRRDLRRAALVGALSTNGLACGVVCVLLSLGLTAALNAWWTP